jgi:predicted nucleotidyltransferase
MELKIPMKYQKDIEIATNLLKNEGCQSIYLFGSLVTGKNHDNSDIDIGIKGLPKGKFFEACSKVYFAIDNEIVAGLKTVLANHGNLVWLDKIWL